MNPTTQKGYWTEGTIVGGTNVGGGQFVPNTEPISKVITQDDLNKTTKLNPVPPITPITPYTPTVTAPSGMAISADGTASYTPPAQKVESQATSSLYQKALSDIGVDITQLEKRPEVQAQLQEQQQLAQKTEQATKDYNTYNLRKRELEKKIQEMEATNPQGQFGGAREAVINDYRRKANSELADLAIQAQASQGLLDAARQTIKDTIDAQFSPIEDRIARRTQYAQLAANDLTESEKYQLDQLNKKDEANQKEVSIYATNLANTVFENGAPVGVRTKIFNIAGDYATGKITKEQAQAKMMEAAGTWGVKPITASKPSGTTYVSGSSPVVDAWAERIQNGSAKITDIPAAQPELRNQVTIALQTMGNSLDGKPTTTELGKSALMTAKALKEKLTTGGIAAIGGRRMLGGAIASKIPGTPEFNLVNDFNSLKSQLSLEGVKYLKGQGQVSDAERALLAQAVTKLNLGQSTDEFKTTLDAIINKLNGGVEEQIKTEEQQLIYQGYSKEQIEQIKNAK